MMVGLACKETQQLKPLKVAAPHKKAPPLPPLPPIMTQRLAFYLVLALELYFHHTI